MMINLFEHYNSNFIGLFSYKTRKHESYTITWRCSQKTISSLCVINIQKFKYDEILRMREKALLLRYSQIEIKLFLLAETHKFMPCYAF